MSHAARFLGTLADVVVDAFRLTGGVGGVRELDDACELERIAAARAAVARVEATIGGFACRRFVLLCALVEDVGRFFELPTVIL